jgi:hypothetical protein
MLFKGTKNHLRVIFAADPSQQGFCHRQGPATIAFQRFQQRTDMPVILAPGKEGQTMQPPAKRHGFGTDSRSLGQKPASLATIFSLMQRTQAFHLGIRGAGDRIGQVQGQYFLSQQNDWQTNFLF